MQEITDLGELKCIELNIMKKIHNFCEEKGLNYYLGAGTLIGAVRHKGFIPWDDDIDILMFREDADRFLKEFNKYGESFQLQAVSYNTKPCYCRPMIKVIDTRTYLTEVEYPYDDPIGVFVDIWIMDGVPQQLKCTWTTLMLAIRHLIYLCVKVPNENENVIKRLVRYVCKRVFNRKWLVVQFDKLSRKFSINDSDEVTCYLGMIKNNRTYQKTWFRDKILLPFEDTFFYVPIGYDGWLINRYGDYMTLPPEKDRIAHHITNIYWKA